MAAPVRMLAFNAGSSSLKAELFANEGRWRSALRIVVDGVGRDGAALKVAGKEAVAIEGKIHHRAAAELAIEEALRAATTSQPAGWLATVHRVVHGAGLFSAPQRVTRELFASLDSLTALAPLHNPPALDVLRAAQARLAGVPAVAVFDTAFFQSLPQVAKTYAIPAEWRARGIERYGFHGIAHEYLARRCAARSGARARRVITLQLGSGCSAAALRDGRPVDTSMGFTPLEGLVMSTRAGDLDPGVLLHLAREGRLCADIDEALNRGSGLLGLSGQSSDMAELLALAGRGESRATLAIEVFCQRARKYIGAYCAVLDGLDALVFGGGIGENAAAVRSRICHGFGWLGIELDEHANHAEGDAERTISAPSSAVAVHVIPVREEREIARHACECLGVDSLGLES